MDVTDLFWIGGAVILLILVLQVVSAPLALLGRVAMNSVAGGFALMAVNAVGTYVDFHIGLNPVTALIVGILGLPGLVALGVVRLVVG